jgi:hypothetical protein
LLLLLTTAAAIAATITAATSMDTKLLQLHPVLATDSTAATDASTVNNPSILDDIIVIIIEMSEEVRHFILVITLPTSTY